MSRKPILKKRSCEICGKRLSIWNKEKICHVHQTGMIVHNKTPVTGCTSYNVGAGDDPAAPNWYLKPGDEGYNDQAFSTDIEGVIDADGSLFKLDLTPNVTED